MNLIGAALLFLIALLFALAGVTRAGVWAIERRSPPVGAFVHNYFHESILGIQVLWIYVIGIGCAVYHFANGLWNVGYHWGLTVSPRAQRWWGFACGLIGVTLLAVGLATLHAFWTLQA